MNEKTFDILDENDNSVLGAPVTLENAAFLGLEEILNLIDDKEIKDLNDLEVNEYRYARFSKSNIAVLYKVLRTE